MAVKVGELVRKAGKVSLREASLKGSVRGSVAGRLRLPPEGEVNRYILTSAQNNTKVHEPTWRALRALALHYGADIIVGTFSYDTGAYGRKSVKRGTYGGRGEKEPLGFAPELEERNPSGRDYICDERVELGRGLVWCGEMNILPTQMNPLSSLETYSQRKSAVFPHAKMAMRSVPSLQGEGVKLNYTTGTVTQRNYIQKRFGLIAEHHHVYGGLLVEVNHEGNWWVRQLNCTNDGELQDLGVRVCGGRVTTGNRAKAITWGDLHGTMAEEWVVERSQDMLDELRPEFQFLHDVMAGESTNRHVVRDGAKNNPHYSFWRWKRGHHRVDAEVAETARVIKRYLRPWCQTVAPDANHDAWWLLSWLSRYDYRPDPANARLFLKLQSFVYEELDKGRMSRDIDIMGHALGLFGLVGVRFLLSDDSFRICGGKIECGMHGHLGPNGQRGTPEKLAKMGRKANIAHTHSAGIWDGLYVAGTSSRMKWTYNWGPSSWSHSHVVTYPNGKRSIVTMYAGDWKARGNR